MPQYVDTNTKTFYAGGAIARYLRVKLTAGKLAAAGSADVELGTIEEAALAENDLKAVRLRTAAGTALMVASEAITLGNDVYAATGGKVAASGTVIIGKALEAAGANNDIIEVLRRSEASDSEASGGTTGAAFLIDTDATTPKLELAGQTGGTGDFKVTLKPPATITADRVHTLPADSDQTLVGATATQTLTNKTLTTPTMTINIQAVAAAGSAQGDAGAVTAAAPAFVHGTAADGTKGIVLPAAAAGKMYIVKNSDAANAVLKVYPASGDAINALSADAAISMAAKTSAVFVALDATTWYTVPLLPS
jgi:hypothetical protein